LIATSRHVFVVSLRTILARLSYRPWKACARTVSQMSEPGDYFFCGIGGSGMTPLALIVQARGSHVEGSDRALDQGRNAERFEFLRARGVLLHPQDGSGIKRPGQILVTSAEI